MAVAWHLVRDRLAAVLPGVLGPAVAVYNGPVVTGTNPRAYLTLAHTVAVADLAAGTFEQDVADDGFAVTERGGVVCEMAAVTGDTRVPDVFSMFDAIASYIQSDMTLGGTLSQGSTLTALATVVEAQTTAGAVQRLLITFNYFTRL